MVEIFTVNVNKALDHVAPFKTFQVKYNYRFGISQQTKDLMKQRDCTRETIKKSKGNDKLILLTKYKKLRNSVNQRLRRENIIHNEQRVEKAKN